MRSTPATGSFRLDDNSPAYQRGVESIKAKLPSTNYERFDQVGVEPQTPVRQITILVALVIGVLFIPYFHSLTTWAAHREIVFEDGSVALPTRWTNEGDGHLLNIRRSGVTFIFPYESTITIDPFAERWPSRKLENVSDLWLRLNGSPVFTGRFKDSITGRAIAFPSQIKCVSPAEDARENYVRIYSLSADSVHSFEFFGKPDAIEAFAQVCSEALQIIEKHPGRVIRM